MLAAFSVPLDQSDDAVITTLCLEGFHHAIHVTSVMSLKTHRDAFVTSLAKFTSLHSPADIKQKNIEAIKAIVKLAEEEGNYLQDAWEHILTCVSRFEHLHLLGEGAPPDATFFAFPQTESGNSPLAKPNSVPAIKERAPGKLQYAASAMIRGSYDGSGVAGKASNTVTSEQMNNLISNLNLLEQVGDMSRIFTRSQRLNSEAIIDFVKALCKVSMDELRSPSDPRVFSLTKIVEIAHYNMNRIRLVWSSIWHVLSDFFVTIGCSDNLSIAIFAMDSLRQLSMKFLEREELANYNFQNEFMKPFVVVMRKSGAVEIRELIIRCVSQMVLSRVDNVKSGWKSMFMIFTTAAHDAHKNIVFLSFEMVEKIIRDYFPHITETETTTFTDCVNCLVAFTNCKFEKDISLQAIAFLQYCARKLAEGYVGSSLRRNPPLSPQGGKIGKQDSGKFLESDEHLYSWFPLLAGLSELSFDPRAEIRKVALKVLFDTLRNHGDHFSLALWERVFESVLFRIFDYVRQDVDPSEDDSTDQRGYNGEVDQESWLYETCSLALQLVVDLFVNFYKTVNPLLKKVLMLFVSLIKRPHQSLAGAGIAALVRLMRDVGHQFSNEQWLEVVSCIKEAADATSPDFSYVTSEDLMEDVSNEDETNDNSNDALRRRNRQLHAVVTDAKSKASIQIFVIQAVTDIYDMYRMSLTANHMLMLFDAMHGIGSNAHKINADLLLRSKLQELGSSLESQEAPLLRLENESFQTCMTFLDNLISDQPVGYNEAEIESHLISLCREVLEFYINISCSKEQSSRWAVPSGSGKKKELTARAPLVVAAIQTLGNMGESLFKKNLPELFPLIATLISCEHGSGEVQVALSDMLQTSMGPVLLRSCC
jgi:brefeldin A-inhibited guanine nucleotide-exchange protein